MSFHEKRTKRSITTNDKPSSAGSKKVFDPELESFTKRTRIDSSINHESSKTQKLTIDKLVEKILYALNKFYGEDESGFYVNCKEFLTKGFLSWKLNIVDRMSTYEYVELAIGHKSWLDIEAEIVKEWKKNYLLYAIRTYWYNGVQHMKFQSLKQFRGSYDIFCDFVAQISALMFRGWLSGWEKRIKDKDTNALDKIYEQTSHFIITDSSEFKKVYEKILLRLIEYEAHGKTVNFKYDLTELKAKKCVFDLDKEHNLTKTIEVLRKFSKEYRMSKKIELIREYRKTLEEELNYQVGLINENSPSKKYEVFEKDDYINSLIYCVVRGKLEDLRATMVYMQTLLGENLTMLSKFQLNSYAIDLVAVTGFLCETKTQIKCEELEDEVLRNLPAMQLHNRFVSSPEIPAENDDFTCGFRKNLTEKQITEFQIKE